MTRTDSGREVLTDLAQAHADARLLIKRLRRQWEGELDEARARSDQELALRLDRLRSGFRAALHEARSDSALSYEESTPALADWDHAVWGDVADGGPAASYDASRVDAVRLGDFVLSSRSFEGERVAFPLPMATGSTGVVAVDYGTLGSQPVRAGLIGFCARLLSCRGPGTMSVAWFDEDVREDRTFVPEVWRPNVNLREHLTMLGERLSARWQAIDASYADGDAARPPGVHHDATFDVTVVIGPSPGSIEEVRSWLDVHARDGPRLGSLLIVASEQAIASAAPGMLRIAADEDSGSFVLPDEIASEHDFVFQAAPHEQMVRRLAERSVTLPRPVLDDPTGELPPDSLESSPGQSTESSTEPSVGPSAEPPEKPKRSDADDPETAPPRQHAPSTNRDEDVDSRSSATPDPGSAVASRGSGQASWLASLLREPPTTEPTLTVGRSNLGGHASLAAFDDTIVLGGDELVARGVLASCLIETVARTRPGDLRTQVLDLGQDADTVDLFEAIGSQVPHVVNVSEGIYVVPALEEIADRSDKGRKSRSRLLVIVFDPGRDADESRRVNALIERIASEGPDGSVTVLVWSRSRDPDHWPLRAFRFVVDVEAGRMGVGGPRFHDTDADSESALRVDVEPVARLEDLVAIRDELWRARR